MTFTRLEEWDWNSDRGTDTPHRWEAGGFSVWALECPLCLGTPCCLGLHAVPWLASNDRLSKSALSLLGWLKNSTFLSSFYSNGLIPEYSSDGQEMKVNPWLGPLLWVADDCQERSFLKTLPGTQVTVEFAEGSSNAFFWFQFLLLIFYPHLPLSCPPPIPTFLPIGGFSVTWKCAATGEKGKKEV